MNFDNNSFMNQENLSKQKNQKSHVGKLGHFSPLRTRIKSTPNGKRGNLHPLGEREVKQNFLNFYNIEVTNTGTPDLKKMQPRIHSKVKKKIKVMKKLDFNEELECNTLPEEELNDTRYTIFDERKKEFVEKRIKDSDLWIEEKLEKKEIERILAEDQKERIKAVAMELPFSALENENTGWNQLDNSIALEEDEEFDLNICDLLDNK